jgi:hypothetical protein
MKRQAKSMALLVTGICAGIALVLSCGSGPSNTMAQSCGSCTVSGPIQIAGPTKVITADTDSAQLSSGTAPANGLIATGPFVLTDLSPNLDPGQSVSAQIGAGTSCPLTGTPIQFLGYQGAVVGARIFVPAGSVACAPSGASWAGFKPY